MATIGSVRLINSPFVWDISNFPDKCKEVGKYIESPSFTVEDIPLEKINCKLRLYLLGHDMEDQVISPYLYVTLSKDIHELEVSYKFYLWNNDEPIPNKSAFTTSKFDKTNPAWGVRNFLKRYSDELKNHLAFCTDSTLSIACSIRIINSNNNDNLSLYDELFKSLNPFFLSDNLSDVTIKIDGKELKAHKIVLSARSKVFKAMLNHDMRESNDNVIIVTDIGYEVMKEVLRYIYCGEVEKINLLSKDLLAAADKYNISSLKRICIENLLKNLNITNACEILIISNMYNCSRLKEKTIEFIIKNMKAVIDTDKFGEIKDSDLLGDILRKVALKNIT